MKDNRRRSSLVSMYGRFWGEKKTFALVNLEPHAVLPPDSHIHEQAGYILEGEIEFTVGGQIKVL